MPIRDPFLYDDRFDTVGLDCRMCRHFKGPPRWPDISRVSSCKLHNVTLAIEIGENGFKHGEWFCRDYADDSNLVNDEEVLGVRKQVQLLNDIRGELKSGVLYGLYGNDGYLTEHQMSDFGKTKAEA